MSLQRLQTRRVNMAEGTTEKVENDTAVARVELPADDLAAELLIKHPLQNTWTLWYYENDKSKGWEENQREITDFNTVEDFWALHNHIKAASELRSGCDYSLFKTGIKPMWEDEQNRRGGRWVINLEKKQRCSDLDACWLEVILCMIGEAFDEHTDEVNGAVVSIRTKGDKIGVWTGDAIKGDSVQKIGLKLKERLNIPPKSFIGFQTHMDTMNKSGSVTKNRFTV